MFKVLLGLFLSFFILQQSYAQSFTLTRGDTMVAEADPYQLRDSESKVKNVSSSNLRMVVTREILSLGTNHINYFCWGINCYGPGTDESPDTIVLAPQEENNTFKGYVDPSGGETESRIRYCFINADNASDKICYDVKYLFGVASVTPGGGAPKNVPSVPASYDVYSQTIRVNVTGGKIETMNMLGQNVDLTYRYDGSGMVADASSLKAGYYFLFGVNERGPWSARVVVSK